LMNYSILVVCKRLINGNNLKVSCKHFVTKSGLKTI
jgi:hypothetical protein